MDSEQIIELASDFDSFLNGLYAEDTELEESFFEQDDRVWTYDELKTAFATNNVQEVIPALDYLYFYPKGNERFIEESMIILLQTPILEIKQLAATYANEFSEKGVLSSMALKEIVFIIRNDSEIDYYADMYFREN